jgi:hypothetical protein
MLFSNDLEQIIFDRHRTIRDLDNFVILSGYVGPSPVDRLRDLPFPCKVVYGMYGSDGISQRLHESLMSLQEEIENIEIYYSTTPVHSKCYAWREGEEIQHALVGSANFSANGLRTPFREILAETTSDTFSPLESYIDRVLGSSVLCTDITDIITSRQSSNLQPAIPGLLTFLDRRGNLPSGASGLNWGQNPENHTNPNDAYIPIRKNNVRANPELFPPKQLYSINVGSGRAHRHNDSIEILWDDGYRMNGLLEGSQDVDGNTHPKQISSFPSKSEMGEYFRNRLGVPLNQEVQKSDLERYGRADVNISLIGEGIYMCDFSV